MTDSRLQAQAKLVKVEQANDDMERSVRMMEMTAEQSQSRLDDATENEAFLQGEMEEKVEMINHLEGAMKGPLLVGRLPALATPLPHVPPWSRSSSQRSTLPLTPPPPRPPICVWATPLFRAGGGVPFFSPDMQSEIEVLQTKGGDGGGVAARPPPQPVKAPDTRQEALQMMTLLLKRVQGLEAQLG